jgi:hypothetical protein
MNAWPPQSLQQSYCCRANEGTVTAVIMVTMGQWACTEHL